MRDESLAHVLMPHHSCLMPKKSVERICKPNSVPQWREDHSSVTRVSAVIEQPTRKLMTGTGGPFASLFGLAPQGVCRAIAARAGCGALLPHRFTLAPLAPRLRSALGVGGLFSVALSVAFPRLDVTQPAPRWSSASPPRPSRGAPPDRP